MALTGKSTAGVSFCTGGWNNVCHTPYGNAVVDIQQEISLPVYHAVFWQDVAISGKYAEDS